MHTQEFAGRALVVDDNAVNRVLATRYCRELGFAVEAVGDGHAALSRLESARYDLVLSDLQMPGMSGLELCRLVRAAELPSQPMIVAFSAHARPADAPALLSLGFDAVILKPATLKEFRSVILGLRHSRPATTLARDDPAPATSAAAGVTSAPANSAARQQPR